MKRFATAIAIVSCALATAVACSSADAPSGTPAGPDASPPDASQPDAASPEDAGYSAPRDAAYDAADEPVTCAVTPCAVGLAAGFEHVCALISDGTVRCWGGDFKGALGAGASDASENDVGPVEVANIVDANQIGAGGYATCARLADGNVKCWGNNDKGQLGLTAETPTFDEDAHPTPASVSLTGSAVRLEVGHDSTCARLASGEYWCWGANEKNQLLRPDSGAVGAPAPLTLAGASPPPWSSTAFGSVTGYAITNAGRLASWGVVSGRNTSFPFDPEPRELPTLAGVTAIAAGPAILSYQGAFSHTCVIAAGSVYCWGKTFEGDVSAFCTGVPSDQRVPVAAPIHGTAFPQQIAVARVTTCARLTDGTVECCGDDSRGQLGLGKVSENRASLAFTRASALSGYAVQVVTGVATTCALLRDGRVQCWGGNEHGELGQRTVDTAPHPTPLTVSF